MSVLSRFWPLASWSSPQKDRSLREPYQPCQPARDLPVSPIKRHLGEDPGLVGAKHPSGIEDLEQATKAKRSKIVGELKFSKSREMGPKAGPDLGLSPLARQESPLRRKPGPRLVRDIRNSPAPVRDLRNSPVRDSRNIPARNFRNSPVRDLRNNPVRDVRPSPAMTPILSSSASRTGTNTVRQIVMGKAGVIMTRQAADVRFSSSSETSYTCLAMEATEEALGVVEERSTFSMVEPENVEVREEGLELGLGEEEREGEGEGDNWVSTASSRRMRTTEAPQPATALSSVEEKNSKDL